MTLEEIEAKNIAVDKAKKALEIAKSERTYKVLLTGFDPFQLNPDIEFKSRIGANAAETFNPAGIIALALNRKLDNLLMQCCIFPVRYEDFDNNIVETTIGKYINDVDLLITTSLNSNTRNFEIEKYAIAYRGAFHDNQCIGIDDNNGQYDSKRYTPNTSTDLTETTLSQEKIFGDSNTIQIEIGSYTIIYDESHSDTKGSGGNYLSNEVMYRSTKLRNNLKINKPVGHFHLGNLKNINSADDTKNIVIEVIKKIFL